MTPAELLDRARRLEARALYIRVIAGGCPVNAYLRGRSDAFRDAARDLRYEASLEEYAADLRAATPAELDLIRAGRR